MSFGGADASIHVEVSATDSKFRRTLETSKRDLRQWGREMRTLGSGLTFNPVTTGMAALSAVAANTFAEYEKHINRAQAVTGATVDMMGQLKDQALSLGKSTIFSAQQAAEGMGFLGMAGFDALEVFKAMPGVTKLAAIGMTSVSKAADIATNILLGFGLEVDSLARVNDVLAAAITDSNTDLRKLGSALSYAAPLAKAAGWGLEEASAAIMSVSDAGIQGTRAGTSLRNMIMRLTKPSAKAAEIMRYLGVNVLDSSGQLKDLDKIVEEFTPHMEKAGEMAAIFGARAAPGMLKILRSGVSDFREDVEELLTSFGLADEMADVMLQGFYGKWVRLKSAIHTLGIEIGDALSEPLGDIAEFITNNVVPAISSMAEWFSELPRPVQYAAIAIGTFVTALGPILWAVGPMVVGLGFMVDAFRKMKAAGGIVGLLAQLRALFSGVGIEAAKTSSKVAAVAASVGAAGAAIAGAKKVGRPHPGVIRTTQRRPEHGLFRREMDHLGDGAYRRSLRPNVVGTHPRAVPFGIKIDRSQIDKVKETTLEVENLGKGITKITSKGDDVRKLSVKLGALGEKAGALKNLRLSLSGIGIALTGFGLISDKFSRLTNEVFGVGFAFLKAGFRGIGNDVTSLVGLITGTGSAVIGWWQDLKDVVDEHVIPDWVGDLADKLRDYKDFINATKPSGFFGAKVELDSPEVKPIEDWGAVPESMREHARLPSPFADKRYDFSDMAAGVTELESRVRRAREEFERGEISIGEYSTKLGELTEGQKGQAFLAWLKGGSRSIEEQNKWLAEYDQRLNEVAGTLNNTSSIKKWSKEVEDARKDLIAGKIGLSEFTEAITGLEDATHREAVIEWLKDTNNESKDVVKFLETLRNEFDLTAQSAQGLGTQLQNISFAQNLNLRQGVDESFMFGPKQIPPSMMQVADDGSYTLPGGTGMPEIGDLFAESEDEAEEFDRMFANLAHVARRTGGEVSGAIIEMSQVSIVAFKAMSDGIKAIELASIILAALSAVLSLANALGIAGKTAEEISGSFDNLNEGLDGVRSGSMSAAEALDYMANWQGNKEGYDFLRNVIDDFEAVGKSSMDAEKTVIQLWSAMQRMDQHDPDSAEYKNAAEDYATAAEKLVNVADAARIARQETEWLNQMTGVASEEMVESLAAADAAWASLDEATQNTSRATKVYAEVLIEAREAGIELNESQLLVIERYREQTAATENLNTALQNQIGTYFSIADNAQAAYDQVYEAAIKAGKGEEEAARLAAEYQAAIAEWTMQVEEIKFKRMAFLEELLYQIRVENYDGAAAAAEDAAARAIEAWAKASEILEHPAVQEILGGMELPDRPKPPSFGGGRSRGGGGGGRGGSLPEAGSAQDLTTRALRTQIGTYFSLMDSARETYEQIKTAAIEAGKSEQEASRIASAHAAEMADWTVQVEEIKFKRMVFLDELLKQIRMSNEDEAAGSAEKAANRAVAAWAKAKNILNAPGVKRILGSLALPNRPDAPKFERSANVGASTQAMSVRYSHVIARQHGGSMLPGMSYVVGENGPELLKLNSLSGMVSPNLRYADASSPKTPMGGASAFQGRRMVRTRTQVILVDAESKKELVRGVVDELQDVLEERGY